MNWFGLVIISTAALLAMTAAWAAFQPTPNHPFVEKSSRPGGVWFIIAALAYIISVVINFNGAAGISLFPASAGLVFLAAGWVCASNEEKPR